MKSSLALSRRNALLGTLGLTASALLPRNILAQDKAAEPRNSPIYRFQIGSIEAISFSDGTGIFAPLQPLVAPEAKPEELQKVLEDHFQPADSATMHFNVLLLQYGKHKVLVDAGYGSFGGANTGQLMSLLKSVGVAASDITGIILSHAHGDHFGGLVDSAGASAFPNASIQINQAELNFWTSDSPALPKLRMDEATKQKFIEGAKKTLAAVKQQINPVKPGDTVFDAIEITDAAGHTAGHIAMQISDGKESLTHIADTAHHSVIMLAQPEWTIAFDADPAMAVATRKKLFKRIADARSRVYGYHMPFPGVGRIRVRDGGYEWVGEAWGL